MELNAEQIKKDMEHCINDDCDKCSIPFGDCQSNLITLALALITSMEQRIKELTEENEYLKSTDIGELQQEYDSLAKSLEDAIELIDKLRAKKAKLTEENERLSQSLANLKLILANSKADTVMELKNMIAQSIGTYTDKSFVYVTAMFRLIDQIAKEMLEGQDGTR